MANLALVEAKRITVYFTSNRFLDEFSDPCFRSVALSTGITVDYKNVRFFQPTVCIISRVFFVTLGFLNIWMNPGCERVRTNPTPVFCVNSPGSEQSDSKGGDEH